MNSDKVVNAIKDLADKISLMSQEELQVFIEDSRDNRCFPDSCHGTCQGMGWCYVCEDFRGELTENYMEDLMP